MIDIQFTIDSKELQNQLDQLAERCTQRQPLMRQIAGVMEAGVQDNFAAGGRPQWLPLNANFMGPVKSSTKSLLVKSGTLKGSINSLSDNNSAIVGTNVVYAGIHNFGGQTKPHVIRPKHKKALKFNGRYVKKVNHPGSKIPKREFLVLTDDEIEEISHTISKYLAGDL